MAPVELAILVALNLWIAWRYSGQDIGPDEGIWLLTGFTGARYGKDYVDCKPPGIHIWMALLAKLTRCNLPLTKALHHAAVGGMAVGAYLLSGSFGTGLLATTILQSAWLRAYQSWMDAVSGGLLLLAFLTPPFVAVPLIGLACFFNVKAAVPGAVWVLWHGMWAALGIYIPVAVVLAGAWWLVDRDSLEAAWYGAIVVPRRMTAYRKANWVPTLAVWDHGFAISVLCVTVIIGVALFGTWNPALWAAVIAYIAFNTWGRVWRPNHFLPLAVVAAAAPPTFLALLPLAMEWLSVRLYLGNIYAMTYPGLAKELGQARMVGEGLAEKEGSLWVNTYHTQIYVYAGKKPRYNVEQLEIRDVTPERNRLRDRRLKDDPPDYIVIGPGFSSGHPRGYRAVGDSGLFKVLA